MPNRVRPEFSRSGRARKKCRSTRKYSCSAPQNDTTRAGWWPNSFSTRSALSAIACCERSSGVLWSSASPVIETKTVGMHRVLPFGFSSTYAGLVTSQPV